MDRRTFLAALPPLVAGCFGGRRRQSTPTATATPTETPEPTATPTPTPTATPTETPEPTPSGAAAQLIDDAQDRFTEAVYVYTGGVTDDLLSVTAETEDFRAREVLLRLDRVQRALQEAEAEATTEGQRTTIDSLDTMQQFLTLATDAQSWVIDGHDALRAAYRHLDDTNLDDAEADLERVGTAADEAAGPTSTMQEEKDVDSASATDAIGSEEYAEKITQLTAEADMLATLQTHASDLRNGISSVADARDLIDADRTSEAANTADQAYDTLRDVEDRLDELLSDFPERADAFEEIAEDLLDLASSSAASADGIRDEYA
ncbi:MAG: hypothetical protein ABEI80_07025 [Haloplanus sp.]